MIKKFLKHLKIYQKFMYQYSKENLSCNQIQYAVFKYFTSKSRAYESILTDNYLCKQTSK